MISAKEARELTKTQIDDVLIKPYLDMLDILIQIKAKNGIDWLYDPFCNCTEFQIKRPNVLVRKAISSHLTDLGYDVSPGQYDEIVIKW
jgi:hypothetical protein